MAIPFNAKRLYRQHRQEADQLSPILKFRKTIQYQIFLWRKLNSPKQTNFVDILTLLQSLIVQ